MNDLSAKQAATITIAAAAILNADNEMLLVRKAGTTAFMQPGGKLEKGERPVVCLLRELEEELGLNAQAEQLVSMGVFTAIAANEANTNVVAHLFLLQGQRFDGLEPRAEIEQMTWVNLDTLPAMDLAPLTQHQVVPAVVRLLASAA